MALIVCFLCDIMGVVGQVERLGGGPKEGGGARKGRCITSLPAFSYHHFRFNFRVCPWPQREPAGEAMGASVR